MEDYDPALGSQVDSAWKSIAPEGNLRGATGVLPTLTASRDFGSPLHNPVYNNLPSRSLDIAHIGILYIYIDFTPLFPANNQSKELAEHLSLRRKPNSGPKLRCC